MIGLGALINTGCIIVGGLLGTLFGKWIPSRMKETLIMACGISTLFLGIAGALEGMLSISDGKIVSGNTMLLILSLVLGSFLGELLKIEDAFERFGVWLKKKTGNQNDDSFISGFLTASLTVCIGAMAIIGAIEDGTKGDYSTLALKGVLDFVIVLIMASTLGKGCIFSCIPVLLWEGLLTLLGYLFQSFLSDVALTNISFVGSVLIFCVGVNLVWNLKIRVANMLPAILLCAIAAYLPI